MGDLNLKEIREHHKFIEPSILESEWWYQRQAHEHRGELLDYAERMQKLESIMNIFEELPDGLRMRALSLNKDHGAALCDCADAVDDILNENAYENDVMSHDELSQILSALPRGVIDMLTRGLHDQDEKNDY